MKGWQALLLFLGVSFALYANSFKGDFVFDDISTFRRKGVRDDTFAQLMEEYRPLRYLSYRIDETLFGSDKPWVYHLGNTIYHGLTAFVVYLLLRNLAGVRIALAGALLFAAHPVQTEAVAYMSGRRDVLSTLLYLLAFLGWVSTSTSRFELTTRRRGRWLVAILALFVLAVLTKEMAITLPAVCLLYDVVLAPARARRRARASLLWPRLAVRGRQLLSPPLYALGIAGAVLGVLYVLSRGATHQDWWGGSVASNFATSATLLPHYAWLLLFPLHLLGDHSYDAYPLSKSFLEPGVIASLAGIVALVAAAVYARRRAPLVTFSIGWFLITLLPVLHIKPFHELAADHYLYLPSVGFCLLAGVGFDRLLRRKGRSVAWAALALVLAAYAARTVVRNLDWRDNETFWKVTLADAPRCARASFNLGTLYAQRSKNPQSPTRMGDLNTAAFFMRRAVEIRPDYAVARVNYGRVCMELGNRAEARTQWEESLKLLVNMDDPPVDPGLVYLFLERYDDAIAYYEGVLARDLHPLNALQGLITCHRYLATRAMVDGRRQDALPHFKKALEAAERLLLARPRDKNLLSTAAMLAKETGDTQRAQELERRARDLGSSR
jgi:tetratricopeptide (TPR) repeat protein